MSQKYYIYDTNKRTMKRYYYELMDEDYNSYEAAIPDGRVKTRAIAQAKRAMRDLGDPKGFTGSQ